MAAGVPSYTRTTSGAFPGPTRASQLFGFSARETAGAAAVFRLRDGGATGQILDTVGLAASGSTGDWYGPQGKRIPTGPLYLELVSGAAEVVAHIQ